MDRKVEEKLNVLWRYLHYEDILEPSDFILGFGSNDTSVAKRAAGLYHKGLAPIVLFSGGIGKGTKDWQVSEADLFADIAINLGVPQKAVLIENKSTNTGENIKFSKELLIRNKIPSNRAIIVHQPNMGRRIHAALLKQWSSLEPLIAPCNISLHAYIEQLLHQGATEQEIASNIVGDFQRIDIYAKLGFQAPMVIPTECKNAYSELVAMGYSDYLV